MPKLNRENLEQFLVKNPIRLSPNPDNKPINFNLKIEKRDYELLNLLCSELVFVEAELSKKSELINYIIENLILANFEALQKEDEYIALKMAETVDEILRKKHFFQNKENFSWVTQIIGERNREGIIYNYEVDPKDYQEMLENTTDKSILNYNVYFKLLNKYKKEVLDKNENSK